MAAERNKASKRSAKTATRRAKATKTAKSSQLGKATAAKATAAKATAAKATAAKATAAKAAAAKAAAAKATKPAKAAASAGTAKPAKAVKGLREGDSIPSFSLIDQRGETVSSGSLAGRPFVLYFYPKDDTPGCTREACGFRDDHGRFRAAGVEVLGVSPDKSESHARFAKKYGLNFTLLSDADKTLANAFGVWVKKQNYGREYMGIERSTFLVDARGEIQKVWRAVRVDGHVAAVLAASGSTVS